MKFIPHVHVQVDASLNVLQVESLFVHLQIVSRRCADVPFLDLSLIKFKFSFSYIPALLLDDVSLMDGHGSRVSSVRVTRVGGDVSVFDVVAVRHRHAIFAILLLHSGPEQPRIQM